MSIGAAGARGGKGTSSVDSPAANTLAGLAEQFATETTGARTGLLDAMQEVLTSGGSSIPIVSQAVESSKQAASRATTQTTEDLARGDMLGTPFGEAILASTRQQGEQSATQAGQQLAQQIFAMIPNFILGQGQTALGGLAGAIPGMSKTKETAITAGAGK